MADEAEKTVCFLCGRPHERSGRVCTECAKTYGVERPFDPQAEGTLGSTLRLNAEAPASNVRIPLPPQIRADQEKQLQQQQQQEKERSEAAAREERRAELQRREAELRGVQRNLSQAPPAGSRLQVAPNIAASQPVSATQSVSAGSAVELNELQGAAAVSAQSAAAGTVSQTLVCDSCQTPIDGAAAQFSFCTHCGADLPQKRAASPTIETRAETKTVRDPVRESLRSEAARLEREGLSAAGVRDTRAQVRRIAEMHQHRDLHRTDARTMVSGATVAQTVAAQAMGVPTVGAQSMGVSAIGMQKAAQGMTAQTASRDVNPTLNAVLSFMAPGVGQLLNGQIGKGLLILIAAVVVAIWLGPFSIPMLVGRVLVAIDAYRIGERRRRGEKVDVTEWDLTA